MYAQITGFHKNCAQRLVNTSTSVHNMNKGSNKSPDINHFITLAHVAQGHLGLLLIITSPFSFIGYWLHLAASSPCRHWMMTVAVLTCNWLRPVCTTSPSNGMMPSSANGKNLHSHHQLTLRGLLSG